jgi:hypothetical protein
VSNDEYAQRIRIKSRLKNKIDILCLKNFGKISASGSGAPRVDPMIACRYE